MPESRLRPEIFGSFLPARFQTIIEDEGDEFDFGSVQLEPYETSSYQAARRLQFLEKDSSSQLTPLEKPAFEGSREVKQGKVLSYIPPSSKEGKIYVSIQQEDLIEQVDYWKSTLIGYVIGDTPYMKIMENFVVASAIGKPLYTDSFTAIMARISYAKVLVETGVSKPLLDSIEMVTPTGSFQQRVEYDWRPKFCTECM
ncbi:hypothetical protein H5410_061702 [Solanum commersonii]|uniref:Uncharacterized protein n=1 Tax=Solanum commersonii TaxID=4109 RepID=A0A9J5W9Z8_SOLCO|nr:hypothetical protein H5410_061702 [Solanum commersonii]